MNVDGNVSTYMITWKQYFIFNFIHVFEEAGGVGRWKLHVGLCKYVIGYWKANSISICSSDIQIIDLLFACSPRRHQKKKIGRFVYYSEMFHNDFSAVAF